MKVGIINVTGYAGIELARILHGHPEAELVSVTGRSAIPGNNRETRPVYNNSDGGCATVDVG